MPEAGIQCSALLLKATPSVLSLGRKGMDDRYSFWWHAGELRVIESPEGRDIALELRHNLPALTSARACPVADLWEAISCRSHRALNELQGRWMRAAQPKGPPMRRLMTVMTTSPPPPPDEGGLTSLSAGESAEAAMQKANAGDIGRGAG